MKIYGFLILSLVLLSCNSMRMNQQAKVKNQNNPLQTPEVIYKSEVLNNLKGIKNVANSYLERSINDIAIMNNIVPSRIFYTKEMKEKFSFFDVQNLSEHSGYLITYLVNTYGNKYPNNMFVIVVNSELEVDHESTYFSKEIISDFINFPNKNKLMLNNFGVLELAVANNLEFGVKEWEMELEFYKCADTNSKLFSNWKLKSTLRDEIKGNNRLLHQKLFTVNGFTNETKLASISGAYKISKDDTQN